MSALLHQKRVPDVESGRVFTFKKIPATDAVRVLVPISKMLFEPLRKAAEAAGIDAASAPAALDKATEAARPTADQEKEQTAAALDAVSNLFAALDADELVKVQVTVFKSVLCAGKPIVGEAGINETFDKLTDLAVVFVEALKVNFADFFPAKLSASIAGIAEKFKGSTPPTSTGTSSPPS